MEEIEDNIIGEDFTGYLKQEELDLSPIKKVEKNKNIIKSKVKTVINYDVIDKELKEIKDLNFYKTKKYTLLSNIESSIKLNQTELENKYKKLIDSIKKNYLEIYISIRYDIDLDLELRKGKIFEKIKNSKELMDHESAKKITKNMLNDQIQHEQTILFTEYKYYFEL
jgi:hypothetical protein